jgi:hypothetical protein
LAGRVCVTALNNHPFTNRLLASARTAEVCLPHRTAQKWNLSEPPSRPARRLFHYSTAFLVIFFRLLLPKYHHSNPSEWFEYP